MARIWETKVLLRREDKVLHRKPLRIIAHVLSFGAPFCCQNLFDLAKDAFADGLDALDFLAKVRAVASGLLVLMSLQVLLAAEYLPASRTLRA